MSSPVAVAPAHRADRDAVRHDSDADHNFLPDFAWAAVGGIVVAAACVLLLVATASWSGGSAISSSTRELAGGFLAGFLVVLVARSLTARAR